MPSVLAESYHKKSFPVCASAHRIAVLLAVGRDGHWLTAARPDADMLNHQPHEARHSKTDRSSAYPCVDIDKRSARPL